MKFTAHQHLLYQVSLRAQAITVATVNGTAIRVKDHDEALVVLDVGALGGTSPTLDVTVDEDDDDGAGAPAGTWAAVTGAVFAQILDSARDDAHYVGRLDLVPRKQWLRLTAVGTGTSPTGSFSGGFILIGKTLPVVQVAAAEFNV